MAKGKKGSDGLDWHKSGAHTVEGFPKHKCISAERGNHMGSKATGFAGHGRMSSEHGTGDRGKHHELHNASNALGSSDRTFRKGIPAKAPMNFKGSGSKHSKDL